LAGGQFPVRWVEWIVPGWGQPLANFYQPLFYYLVYFVHVLGFPLFDSIKVVVFAAWILSAVFMFLFLKRLFGFKASIVGGFLYAFSPYFFLDIFVRFAAPETVALAFVPALFWSVQSFKDTRRG